MNPEIIVFVRCNRYHPKYGAYDISEFTPQPDKLFTRVQHLQERGAPEGELALRQRQMNAMARAICRDSAILFALTGDRSDMPDDVRKLVDLCLPPAQTPDEAFPLWLDIARRGAQMELDAVMKANLQPDVKSVLADLIQRRLHVAQQQTDDPAEQAMLLVAVWWMHEELMKVAGVALDAVGLSTAGHYAKEKAHELHPLDTDYLLALTEVEHLPLTKFGERFKQALGKQERLNVNPSGTGKNPEYEHEVAESLLDLPEDAPSPLELAPSLEPDPAEVVVESSPILLAFQQLKPEEQQVVLLHAQGFTDAEIAQMLNLPIETAKKRRQRAVKKLEQALGA